MTTYVTKKFLHPKKPTGRRKKSSRKRPKEALERCFKESYGDFGKSESTYINHSRPKKPFRGRQFERFQGNTELEAGLHLKVKFKARTQD